MFVSANRFETCGISLTKRKGFQRIFDGNKVLYAFQVALKGMIVFFEENLFLGNAFGDIFKAIVAFAYFS